MIWWNPQNICIGQNVQIESCADSSRGTPSWSSSALLLAVNYESSHPMHQPPAKVPALPCQPEQPGGESLRGIVFCVIGFFFSQQTQHAIGHVSALHTLYSRELFKMIILPDGSKLGHYRPSPTAMMIMMMTTATTTKAGLRCRLNSFQARLLI